MDQKGSTPKTFFYIKVKFVCIVSIEILLVEIGGIVDQGSTS
jgi:hypothetical protein